MTDQTGKELAKGILANMAEFMRVCEALDEKTASRAPAGRWSPKQIISHLCGPEGKGILPGLKAFLEQDRPLINVVPEDPFWSGNRTGMTLTELLDEFGREYSATAAFVEGLSEKELLRTANIPMLKESPLGEYPTLAQWVSGLSDYHIGYHTDHMREILEALGHSGMKTDLI